MSGRLAAAASYLFVPATRSDRVEKARRSAADEVIVDLEDAVAAEDKAAARDALAHLPLGRPVHVRVNAPSTSFHDADLRAVAGLAWVSAVVVPKVESADDVGAVAAALPSVMPVIALVETARGIVEVDSIASSAVARLMLGSADYLADIDAHPSSQALAYPRSRLVVASRASRLPPPVDGPTLATDDDDLVRCDAEEARALGLGGKLCIHPAQLAVVNQVFRPSDEQRRWASAVLAAADAHGGGVFAFEGTMVDEPVLVRARRLLGPDSSP